MLIVKPLTIDDIFDELRSNLVELYRDHTGQPICYEADDDLDALLRHIKHKIERLYKPKEGA